MNDKIQLFERLTNDIKTAMKEHDNLKRDCLRIIMSDIKNVTVNAGKEITDEACMKVIQKSVKTHTDSINQFNQAGRFDLADKEKAEKLIIEKYLPKMLSEEMTQSLILKIVVDNQIEEKKQNFGKIMKLLKECPESSSIDMRVASSYLNVLLK